MAVHRVSSSFRDVSTHGSSTSSNLLTKCGLTSDVGSPREQHQGFFVSKQRNPLT